MATQTDCFGSQTIHERLQVKVDDTALDLAVVRRDGSLTPILFLHGWGSTKEDYIDISLNKDFQGRPFIAYDAPGCGKSLCDDLSKPNIEFLVATAEVVLQHFGVTKFHLVGHSMGGLTGLVLANRIPHAVASFVNIKGNLASEDCFISRCIFHHPEKSAQTFLDDFIEQTLQSPFYASGIYAAGLRDRVRPEAIKGILGSMVTHSDNGGLLSKFISANFPRLFMFGEQHATLTYLPTLSSNGVELAEIPGAGHFPMYSNPVAMWNVMSNFIKKAELE
ncbi:Alpha/Beta hydrolase protein [Dactylonectria estremocensis]|uniref:Alpha/Beta hydrolase protein n=1 Tax=Dactylonectria estremocensis TaxID=1079267 RepID=A0A9P9IW78_9HYPO|nr:Alpha/Beta hydrolase protein [Dactylonectria estremocensis]